MWNAMNYCIRKQCQKLRVLPFLKILYARWEWTDLVDCIDSEQFLVVTECAITVPYYIFCSFSSPLQQRGHSPSPARTFSVSSWSVGVPGFAGPLLLDTSLSPSRQHAKYPSQIYARSLWCWWQVCRQLSSRVHNCFPFKYIVSWSLLAIGIVLCSLLKKDVWKKCRE